MLCKPGAWFIRVPAEHCTLPGSVASAARPCCSVPSVSGPVGVDLLLSPQARLNNFCIVFLRLPYQNPVETGDSSDAAGLSCGFVDSSPVGSGRTGLGPLSCGHAALRTQRRGQQLGGRGELTLTASPCLPLPVSQAGLILERQSSGLASLRCSHPSWDQLRAEGHKVTRKRWTRLSRHSSSQRGACPGGQDGPDARHHTGPPFQRPERLWLLLRAVHT